MCFYEGKPGGQVAAVVFQRNTNPGWNPAKFLHPPPCPRKRTTDVPGVLSPGNPLLPGTRLPVVL
ncbi:hypothetical protein C1O51_11950 [Akkermansia muciniphila]|nr:hypothetical protein [Akkermansia muciniphila]QAA53832.1 hypothetical protein C1O50_11980 [Akkermansia muciniphila]QAA56140.1 hypothetical protein C1O51_11950 [Akkermansia muciniphila]QAA58454.1 hypothetical protein C1O54_11940 [Akkermansia muciniphila]